jgi:hypothetical protein
MDIVDRNGKLLISLTTGNGGIVLGGILGTIALLINYPGLEALSSGRNPLTYDLKLTSSGGIVTLLLAGQFILIQGVTP